MVSSLRGSPTLRRRQLGMQLRRLRETAGITIDQVAEKLECSAFRISRIETGQTGVTPTRRPPVDRCLWGTRRGADLLLRFAREARQKGWWQLYGTVLTSAYVGLESAADAVRSEGGR